jgi:hypothetical protein
MKHLLARLSDILDDVHRLGLHHAGTEVAFDVHIRAAFEDLSQKQFQTLSGELAIQGVIQYELAELVNWLLLHPPFGSPGFRIYWRTVGAGTAGRADLELVLEFLSGPATVTVTRLALIKVKTHLSLPDLDRPHSRYGDLSHRHPGHDQTESSVRRSQGYYEYTARPSDPPGKFSSYSAIAHSLSCPAKLSPNNAHW